MMDGSHKVLCVYLRALRQRDRKVVKNSLSIFFIDPNSILYQYIPMSKALSLKMDDRIFEDAEKMIRKIHMPRNAYINKAVDFYTRFQQRLLLRKKLKKDVSLLKEDTKNFIESFELLEDLHED